jgi:hypothetical protein
VKLLSVGQLDHVGAVPLVQHYPSHAHHCIGLLCSK